MVGEWDKKQTKKENYRGRYAREKLVCAFVCLIFLLMTILSGCTQKDSQRKEINVKVGNPEETISICVADNDRRTISYSDTLVQTNGEGFLISNKNSFDVELIVIKQDDGKSDAFDEDDRVLPIKAGKKKFVHGIKEDTFYEIGCRADVDEGTEILLGVRAIGVIL